MHTLQEGTTGESTNLLDQLDIPKLLVFHLLNFMVFLKTKLSLRVFKLSISHETDETSGVKIFIKSLEADFSYKGKENSRYNFLITVQNSRLQYLPIYIFKIVLIF